MQVRILSATNADIEQEVAEGRFRRDLLYRLKTVEIHVPPLRARKDDIPLLASHFLRRHAGRYRKALSGFDASSMQLLLDYSWPGNVRQLDHTVERAVLMAVRDVVGASDLGLEPEVEGRPGLEEMTLEQVERVLINKALSRCHGDVSKAAEALGLSRGALYRRLEKYHIK